MINIQQTLIFSNLTHAFLTFYIKKSGGILYIREFLKIFFCQRAGWWIMVKPVLF